MRKQIDTNGHDFNLWQIDADVNGNSLYVIHFLDIPGVGYQGASLGFHHHIEHARAMLHGQKYRAKWFGGGIVFQAYAGNPYPSRPRRNPTIRNRGRLHHRVQERQLMQITLIILALAYPCWYISKTFLTRNKG